MTFEADQIVDRRRLRRKLSFWRVVAVLALILAVIGGTLFATGRNGFFGVTSPQIARITLSGFIMTDRERDEMMEKLAKNDQVKAVIVSIDSTGGATTGGEALYESLRKLTEAKPTVATVNTVAASAAYMAAIATDHIVARRTSITGSIGVLFQYPEVSQLMDKIGVRVEEVKSAPLKAEPSPFKPASPEARQVIAGIVSDTYNWFVDIVAERRGLARGTALTLADGRIFTGQQALEQKLIDAIGGEAEALTWLARERGIDTKLPIKDWEPERESEGFFFFSEAISLWFAKELGLPGDLIRGSIIDELVPERLKLDGLLSVWQGPSGGEAGPAARAAP
jgi:protease-4